MAQRLRVNPVRCTGHGLCAELLPELISTDEWGYPIVSAEPVPAGLARHASRAVTDCPALALLLTEAPRSWSPGLVRASAAPGRGRAVTSFDS
jgi:ferredoxin